MTADNCKIEFSSMTLSSPAGPSVWLFLNIHVRYEEDHSAFLAAALLLPAKPSEPEHEMPLHI